MIDKVEINLLLDCYEELLTEKQQEICDLYFREDCSYQEIAEEAGISRAAVGDSVKRCCDELHHYEEILHLASDTRKQGRILEKIRNLTEDQEILNLLNELEGKENQEAI